MRQAHALTTRVAQMLHRSAARGQRSTPGGDAPQIDPLAALETRIRHLEALLEGLQDAVHRESTRQNKHIAELESRLEPTALAVALSKHARQRGL